MNASKINNRSKPFVDAGVDEMVETVVDVVVVVVDDIDDGIDDDIVELVAGNSTASLKCPASEKEREGYFRGCSSGATGPERLPEGGLVEASWAAFSSAAAPVRGRISELNAPTSSHSSNRLSATSR